MYNPLKKNADTPLTPKELEVPETIFERDIENRVIQGIVVQCLAKIEGISLEEGNFIDNILGRDTLEGISGVHAEQDNKHQCVNIRVEVNIAYGIPIPEKAEEIQSKIAHEVAALTGLHISTVHVIFQNILPEKEMRHISDLLGDMANSPAILETDSEEKYNDEF